MALSRCFSIVLQSEKLHFTLRQSESLPVVTAVSDSRGGILRVGHLLTAVAGTSLLEEDDGDKYHCALRLIKEASRPCTLCFVEEVQPIGGPDGHEDQQAWRKQSNETEKDLAEDGGEAEVASESSESPDPSVSSTSSEEEDVFTSESSEETSDPSVSSTSSEGDSDSNASSVRVAGEGRESASEGERISQRSSKSSRSSKRITATARAATAKAGASDRPVVNLKSIVDFLDRLKMGWGVRFAGAFGSIGLEDVQDLAETTTEELWLLEVGLKKRGARLRHLRVIKSAVLSATMTPRTPRSMTPGASLPAFSAVESASQRDGGRGEIANEINIVDEADDEVEADDDGVDDGNRNALVCFYASLDGPNWITRTGWRGEKPLPQGEKRRGPGLLHGVTFRYFPREGCDADDRSTSSSSSSSSSSSRDPGGGVPGLLQVVALRLRFNGLCGALGNVQQGVCSADFNKITRSQEGNIIKAFPWSMRFPSLMTLDVGYDKKNLQIV